eukprot:CAMPEP_0171914480 /NCGR_PEP_ID=MMETSP0993-20121228/12862_1 /TAXON_ID=483369 /ORGANISM="non described non described, Strain CCMP2098" /LENGTH=35 /DNA_ID= /DNA_START= /DNA_END= /DNA_ORIENTATION=
MRSGIFCKFSQHRDILLVALVMLLRAIAQATRTAA